MGILTPRAHEYSSVHPTLIGSTESHPSCDQIEYLFLLPNPLLRRQGLILA
jgi:hypothetical protein